MTYLFTFACYGSHLHGDQPGSIDPDHNLFGSRSVEPDPARLAWVRSRMEQPPYRMDEDRRWAVLASMKDRCEDRSWHLLAAHVRTNHVHAVVATEIRPERVMNDLKSCASRHLNESGFDGPERRRWARHGGTRWLWKRENVLAAIRYVIDGQGEHMAIYQSEP
jgi:REP element-mobilizing transposase RayT